MTKIKSLGGETIDAWDQKWVHLNGGLRQPQLSLGQDVGLYRFSLDGQIVAVGTGTDKRKGIAKRFYDLCRPGSSGRNHRAGELIHENRDRLVVAVLITGRGQDARDLALRMREPMIERHQPLWTVPKACRTRRR